MVTSAEVASVYVHFPWCAKKCPYCDFASVKIEAGEIPHEAYADAVLRELEARHKSISSRKLVSIFFGGGTPSMWSGPALGRVIEGIRGAFETEVPELEVTAECNPASLDAHQAQALAEAGVNRLSIGVQSLQHRHLQFLGRLHDRDSALKAIAVARQAVPRVSADLMFGMPEQKQLKEDIATIVDTGVDHVSAYALTIEPGTQFGELHKRGRLAVASDDDYARMFELTESLFAQAGLQHYEVSNYARPGQEARHNLHYWRAGDYLGLGAAAVGALVPQPGRGHRYRNAPEARAYMRGAPPDEQEDLGPQELIREALMLGLRTTEGVNLARLQARAGVDPMDGREASVQARIETGDLQRVEDQLVVPRSRWLFLDSIVTDLF